MAGNESIALEGVEELRRKLAQLGPKLQQQVQQQALLAGGRVIRDAIRDNPATPELTGALKRSVASRRSKFYRGEAYVSVKRVTKKRARKLLEKKIKAAIKKGKTEVQVNSNELADAFYWRFLEFGFMHRGGVHVPGLGFMRKGFDASKDQAIAKIMEHFQRGVARLEQTKGASAT